MADKKKPKALKRQRKERDERRLARSGDQVWNALKGKNPRERITLFSEAVKKKFFAKRGAFGTITCPFCGKSSVLVANPEGVSGKPEHDYIMRHNAKSFLCEGSLVPMKNLFL